MKKNPNAKIVAAIACAALMLGTVTGCGNSASTDNAASEPAAESTDTAGTDTAGENESTEEADETEEGTDASEETTEDTEAANETDSSEELGADGYVYGTYWAVSFDPDAFAVSRDGNETTVAYQNEPAGSTFWVFTETDYETPSICMDELTATQNLDTPASVTVGGKDGLYAGVKTEGESDSGLEISGGYYAVDVNGNVLQIEEFITVDPDETVKNATEEAMSTVLDSIEFEETGDYPDNFMEERTGKFSFDSQEEIIDSLEAGEGYAYVNIMGMDEQVLVITNEVFTPDADTANCLSCYPYYKDADGKYICGSVFSTISTSTPIAVSDDGVVYCATHNDMTELVFDDQSTGIMTLKYLYVEWGEDENTPNTYGGFVRASNSFDAEEIQVAEDDSSYFDEAFEEYDALTPINFTMVE